MEPKGGYSKTIMASLVVVYHVSPRLCPSSEDLERINNLFRSLHDEKQNTWVDIDVRVCTTSEEARGVLPEAQIYICSPLWMLPEIDESRSTPNLRWLHLISAGVDKGMRLKRVKAGQLILTNSSGLHATPVAEHALTHMLILNRNFLTAFRNQQNGLWGRKEFGVASELAGKTVFIAGLGRIGQNLARICSAFGMTVCGSQRSPSPPPPHVHQVLGTQEWLNCLGDADFVVCILPLTQETERIFNERVFRMMKKTAYFVNVGRGGCVDHDALVRALEGGTHAALVLGARHEARLALTKLADGHIAGAGLDVTDPEPLPQTHKLWTLPNVVITPHYAGSTPSYMQRATQIFVDNLAQFLVGGTLPNQVLLDRGY